MRTCAGRSERATRGTLGKSIAHPRPGCTHHIAKRGADRLTRWRLHTQRATQRRGSQGHIQSVGQQLQARGQYTSPHNTGCKKKKRLRETNSSKSWTIAAGRLWAQRPRLEAAALCHSGRSPWPPRHLSSRASSGATARSGGAARSAARTAAAVDSGALLNDPGGAARPIVRPSPAQRKIRKSKVYFGQNRLDPSLRVNGGTLEVGSRSRCFRSGFGAAMHQRIDDEEAFIRKFTAPYAPLVAQKLWYKDSPPPQDHYQPATPSQARQRGFGAGSAELARKLLKKRHSGNVHSRSRGARSGSP